MRALLVTSQITYVPGNYVELFEEVLKYASHHVAGIVILENATSDGRPGKALLKLGLDILGLRLTGCRGVASHLMRNLIELPRRRREQLFESRGIPIYRAKSMNDPSMLELIRSARIDLIVNVRTRCIYKKAILAAPRLGCINIHHGLLPEHRGTLCDLHALSEGRSAGFTIHQMSEKIDAGKILLRRVVSQPGEKNFPVYLKRASRIEGKALANLLHEIARQDKIPDGDPNQCERPVYTRNPTRKQIAKMRKEGMIL